MTMPWRRQVFLYAAVASITSGCGLFVPAFSALSDSLSKPAPGASSIDATTQAKQSARRPGASSRAAGTGGAGGSTQPGGDLTGTGASGEVGGSAPSSGTDGAIGAGAPSTSGNPGAGDSAGLAGSGGTVDPDIIPDPGSTTPGLGQGGSGVTTPTTGSDLTPEPAPPPGTIVVAGGDPPKAGNSFLDFLQDVKKYQSKKQASPTP